VYPSSAHSYTFSQGTSFSAPLVSGIVALVKQCNSGFTADSLKQNLFASCTFLPGQKKRDNLFGRGIPNAVIASMQKKTVFLKFISDQKNSIPQVIVESQSGVEKGVSDSAGVVLFTLENQDLPFTGKALLPGLIERSITVSSLPFADTIIADYSQSKLKRGLQLYPTVFKMNKPGSRRLTAEYYSHSSGVATASIRTVDGRLVWMDNTNVTAGFPARITCELPAQIAPGLYFFSFRHNSTLHTRKIVISG
jgi:hypothetical protein